MSSSLSKIEKNLPVDQFKLLENIFKNGDSHQKKNELLEQKDFYSSRYFNSIDNYNESQLPGRRLRKNSLTVGKPAFTKSTLIKPTGLKASSNAV